MSGPCFRAGGLALLVGVCSSVAARAAADELPCVLDAALSEAAVELLLEGAVEPSADRLAAAVRAAGSDVVAVRARAFSAGAGEPVRRWLAGLEARADAPLACGEADDGARQLVLVAEAGGRLELVPGAPDRLRVSLDARFAHPYVVFHDAEGVLERVAVDDEVLRDGLQLPEELARPVVVQLVAEGRSGPRPVAQRTVGERAGADLGPSTDGDTHLAGRVAALRSHHRASSLRPNRILDAEAAAHAGRVCREGRVAHQLEAGADPESRLRRRGISARVVGETVARARTERRALAALFDSPSHRMTLVDRRFTDAGYGVAVGARGDRCVVVLLAAWPRMVGR